MNQASGEHYRHAEEPIEYTVRVSDRARHVRLSVSARHGLVVVVPRGRSVDVEALVDSRRVWAQAALARVAERRAALSAGPDDLLPGVVELPAIGLSLPVRQQDGSRARAHESDGVLVLTGVDAAARLRALALWLDRTARATLPQRVDELAVTTGLTPTRVRVTHARTRWGSCSARGTVSLSRYALFLTPKLLDALVLHELAHLRVLDHSSRFWTLLRGLDAHADAHRRAMSRGQERIPPWAEASPQ